MKISQAAKIWIDYHVINSKKIYPSMPTCELFTNFALILEEKT